jgi:hypothetical protein
MQKVLLHILQIIVYSSLVLLNILLNNETSALSDRLVSSRLLVCSSSPVAIGRSKAQNARLGRRPCTLGEICACRNMRRQFHLSVLSLQGSLALSSAIAFASLRLFFSFSFSFSFFFHP